MKKYLIAVLLTACLLFSFGTTAFADESGGQEPNANNSATQDKKGHFGYYLSDPHATWADNQLPEGGDGSVLVEYDDNGKVKYKQQTPVAKGDTTTVISAIPTLEGHVFWVGAIKSAMVKSRQFAKTEKHLPIATTTRPLIHWTPCGGV